MAENSAPGRGFSKEKRALPEISGQVPGGTRVYSRDYRDILGGLLLFSAGAAFAAYAVSHYELGSLRRMGPGGFPAALGVVLAVLGLLLAVPAFFRTGHRPDLRFWSPLFVIGGVAAFAIVVRPFGLLPAVVAVVAISSLAELKVRPLQLTLLCAGLCVLNWLVFRVGLGASAPMVNWPF